MTPLPTADAVHQTSLPVPLWSSLLVLVLVQLQSCLLVLL